MASFHSVGRAMELLPYMYSRTPSMSASSHRSQKSAEANKCSAIWLRVILGHSKAMVQQHRSEMSFENAMWGQETGVGRGKSKSNLSMM